MSSGSGHGEWSRHIRVHEFRWHCCADGLDFDDLLHVLGLNACGAH